MLPLSQLCRKRTTVNNNEHQCDTILAQLKNVHFRPIADIQKYITQESILNNNCAQTKKSIYTLGGKSHYLI